MYGGFQQSQEERLKDRPITVCQTKRKRTYHRFPAPSGAQSSSQTHGRCFQGLLKIQFKNINKNFLVHVHVCAIIVTDGWVAIIITVINFSNFITLL